MTHVGLQFTIFFTETLLRSHPTTIDCQHVLAIERETLHEKLGAVGLVTSRSQEASFLYQDSLHLA